MGRIPRPRLRRRRGRLPAVAQRQAAAPLLPRADLPARAATCSTGRSCSSTPTAGRTSTRSASASTPPSRASTCSPSRRRRASSRSTCSRFDDESLLELPQSERRDRLEAHDRRPGRPHALHRGPRRGRAVAAGRRGRDRQAPGRAATSPASASGMSKIKRVRTIDAVVMGWRPGKEEGTVGSLILGLHDDDGKLRVVGHTSGFKASREARAARQARPLRDRRARHGRPLAAGTTSASSSGSTCAPSSSSRSPSTTPPTTASATAPRSSAGATTRTRRVSMEQLKS